MRYKKVPHNDNVIEIDGEIILSFDSRYKDYLVWKDKNPKLEKKLIDERDEKMRIDFLFNASPHVELNENGNKHGKCSFYHENGNLKWEGYYDDGVLDGELKQYEESGLMLSIENFKDGVLHGRFEYYRNGRLRERGTMLDSKKHGEVRSYWINKNLKRIENFRNGIAHGEILEYYIGGELMSKGLSVLGLPKGTWEWYYQNSEKQKEVEYGDDGIRVLSTEWNEQGIKTYEQEWMGHLQHGRCRFWNDKGKLIKHQTYDKGELDGKRFDYYINGEVRTEMTYKKGKLHGKFIDYYFGGVKRSEGMMKFGAMNGGWSFWYQNGKKELDVNLEFGMIKGDSKIYHENGTLKEKIEILY